MAALAQEITAEIQPRNPASLRTLAGTATEAYDLNAAPVLLHLLVMNTRHWLC